MKKFVLFVCLLLTGCGNEISEEMPDSVFIDMKLEDIEVFDEVYVSDLIQDSNVSIEDYKLDTDVIVEKEIELSV